MKPSDSLCFDIQGAGEDYPGFRLTVDAPQSGNIPATCGIRLANSDQEITFPVALMGDIATALTLASAAATDLMGCDG